VRVRAGSVAQVRHALGVRAHFLPETTRRPRDGAAARRAPLRAGGAPRCAALACATLNPAPNVPRALIPRGRPLRLCSAAASQGPTPPPLSSRALIFQQREQQQKAPPPTPAPRTQVRSCRRILSVSLSFLSLSSAPASLLSVPPFRTRTLARVVSFALSCLLSYLAAAAAAAAAAGTPDRHPA
jgi:hypothetical protein